MQQIIDVVARTFGVDASQISATTTSDDIEAWDSLGTLNVVGELEAELGISIPIERIPELTSIQAFAEFL